MSGTGNADLLVVGGQRIMSETPQRGDVLERGLLIGGKTVPASSGKLADDVSPWDGEIYDASPPARRRTSPERPMLPRPRSLPGPR